MSIQGDTRAIEKVLNEGAKVHEDSREVGEMLKTALIVALSRVGTGNVYTTFFWTDKSGKVRPGAKRPTPHQASAPGNPPAPDTMGLMNSVDYGIKRVGSGTEVQIGSSSEAAPPTEFGTKNMEARPWFRVTMALKTPKALEIWAKGIERRERMAARRMGGRG